MATNIEKLEKAYNDALEKAEQALSAKREAKRALDAGMEEHRSRELLTSVGLTEEQVDAVIELKTFHQDQETNSVSDSEE